MLQTWRLSTVCYPFATSAALLIACTYYAVFVQLIGSLQFHSTRENRSRRRIALVENVDVCINRERPQQRLIAQISMLYTKSERLAGIQFLGRLGERRLVAIAPAGRRSRQACMGSDTLSCINNVTVMRYV